MPAHPAHPIHYSFAQAFGERSVDSPHPLVVEDSDIITAVSFNADSSMIATGDRGGRVVILNRVDRPRSSPSSSSSSSSSSSYSSSSSASSSSSSYTKKRCRTAASFNLSSNTTRSRHPDPSSFLSFDRDLHFDHAFDDPDPDDDDDSGSSAAEDDDDDELAHPDNDEHDLDNPYNDKFNQHRQKMYNDSRNSNSNHRRNSNSNSAHRHRQNHVNAPEFKFWTQFQSHEPEFDYLKSMEIEEKINQIAWCRQAGSTHRLITANDKTIKVWKINEKQVKAIAKLNPSKHPASAVTVSSSSSSSSSSTSSSSSASPVTASRLLPPPAKPPHKYDVQIPKLHAYGSIVTATPRRIFSNAHQYHINSISLNSDEVTFLSADDLRIHLWNLEVGGAGFNILDIKPSNVENLSEVITCARFHPTHCNVLMYSSSKGTIKLNDLRKAALCSKPECIFEHSQRHGSAHMYGIGGGTRSSLYLNEVMSSISDVKFSPNGRHILSRDYMNLKLWDMNMSNKPLRVIPIHEYLKGRMYDLLENECIFDKFQCSFSADGNSVLTGSYNSLFQSYSAVSGAGCAVEASVDYVSGNGTKFGHFAAQQQYHAQMQQQQQQQHHHHHHHHHQHHQYYSPSMDMFDASKRILTLDSSATEPIAAVASGPALYVYYAGASNYNGRQRPSHNQFQYAY